MIDGRSSCVGFVLRVLLVACAPANATAAEAALASQVPPPAWAYVPVGTSTPDAARVDADAMLHVPGSAETFTRAQIGDLFHAPDWFPGDHPAMPSVVASGRKPGAAACGFCHLPNGLGRPENASLAGLPADYIELQVHAIRSGERSTSGPPSGPHALMRSTAQHVDDGNVRTAAAYFSGLHLTPWIRVVEATTVPVTRAQGFMLVPDATGGSEPIGERIIEVPEDVTLTERRYSHSGFVAYVPVGSIAKGAALAASGGEGKTLPCAGCHGDRLQGLASVPHLAGRSPSYIVRQLRDIQAGARHGGAVELMKPVVARLTLDDMVALAAYTASLPP